MPRTSGKYCHICRYNKNKQRKGIFHIDCYLCDKTYCSRCAKKHPKPVTTFYGCVYCHNECCCQLKVCHQNHTHCDNYRRKKQNGKRWMNYTKKKAERSSDDEYDQAKNMEMHKEHSTEEKIITIED
jgi:hypothetical protein